MAIAIIESVCKAARSTGYPKKKERKLEAHLSQVARDQGPKGVITLMKSLQKTRLDAIANGSPLNTNWVEFTRSRANPKSLALRDLYGLSDVKFFRVSGAIIESVTKEIAPEDIDDWYRTMSQAPLRGDEYLVTAGALNAGTAMADITRENERQWDKIAKSLSGLELSQSRFNPDMVTKTAIPIGGHVHHLKFTKVGHGDVAVADNDDLLKTYRDSQIYAPDFVAGYTMMKSRLLQAAWIMEFDSRSDETQGSDHSDYLWDGYRYNIKEWRGYTEKQHGIPTRFDVAKPELTLPKGSRAMHADRQVVGTISFLPKPGGKARVVANPNRKVQADITPLGDAIQKVVYGDPFLQTHIFVMNQDQGREYVRNQLDLGTRLSSVDLSSATDTMDYNNVLNLTGYNAWLDHHQDSISRGKELVEHKLSGMFATRVLRSEGNEISARAYESTLSYDPRKSLSLQESTDLCRYVLSERMEEFNQVRTGTYVLDAKTRDGHNIPSPVDGVSFDRGQPLGTRPSFPLLTWANASLGRFATKATGTTAFAVVGDDIVLDANAYPLYAPVMEAMGCKVNDDKTVTSNKIAEFVGYLHEPQRIYPKKPRVTDSDIENAVKFGLDRRHKWLQTIFDDASSGMIYGLDSIATIPSAELTIQQRIAKSANQPSLRDKLIAKDFVEAVDDSSRPADASISTSGQTVAWHIQSLEPTVGGSSWSKPEEHLDQMSYDRAIKFFDHHSMTSKVNLKRSVLAYFRKKASIYDVAKQLHDTDVAIFALSGKKQPSVFFLVGSNGDVAAVTPHEWKDAELKTSVWREIATGDNLHVTVVANDNPVYRDKLVQVAKTKSELDFGHAPSAHKQTGVDLDP